MTFAYQKPPNLPEALALAYANPSAMPILAGGTDLIVQWRTGVINPAGFISISGVDELKVIIEKDDSIEIGALATHAMITSSKIVRRHVAPLAEACATIGVPQIRNLGTMGGNIMNASPAGDTLPVLIACDAKILLQNLTGERWIPAREFFTGYKKTAIARSEILTRISFPKLGKDVTARFLKIGTRRAQAISKVSMCVRGVISHGGIVDISIAVGSVAPTVISAPGTEAFLKGRAITTALIDHARHSIMDEVHPIDDVRSTAEYRKFVCGSLMARYLREATKKKEK